MSKTVTVASQSTFPDTLKKKLRDKTTRDAVTRSFEDALRKDVKGEALKEIRQLNAHVREIDGDFQRIGSELYKFDQEKFLDEDGKVLRLQREWNKHHQRFKDILEQSRHNALKATAVMKQYRKAVLSHFKLEEIPNVQQELKGFIEEVDTKQRAALKSQHSFKKLAEDLRLFATVIEDALERAGARLSVALQNARTRLAQLEKKLATVTTKGAVVGAANSGREYIRARREATALRADIQSCNEELAELIAKEELLKKYQRALGKTQKEIRTLANKIDVIANIWQSLKADMQMLHEELKLVTKGKVITSRFSAKLQAARELYLDLAELLEAYGKSLSPAEQKRTPNPDRTPKKGRSGVAATQMKGKQPVKDDKDMKKHNKPERKPDAQAKPAGSNNSKDRKTDDKQKVVKQDEPEKGRKGDRREDTDKGRKDSGRRKDDANGKATRRETKKG